MAIPVMTRREMLGVAAMAGRAMAAAPRIAHTVLGTVVAVDTAARDVTVQARRLEAWMGAITAIYAVDNEKFLREVRAGDQIMGKIFDGEKMLRHVEILAVSARSLAER